jgi:outer membrane receptor for ferrienterochelin and colicins
MWHFLAAFIFILHSLSLAAQNGRFKGKVESGGEPIPLANIVLIKSAKGTATNTDGKFLIAEIEQGTYALKVSAVGYVSIIDTVIIEPGQEVYREYTLKEDMLNLNEVVVTGTRNTVEKYNSPVIIHTISPKTFEATQSLIIADGLNYSPGLRVENNCQNCGFTQLRMNGLDGAYSQILINSRPTFSSLAGVYGLEMLPANMVQRIEVVRGGGSVMYGGNAIAGTVNIITNDPVENSFEAGFNQSLINGEASDRTLNFNGAIVSEDLSAGLNFYGFNRNRDHWDANGDGFSEIVELRNNTFGFDAFYNFNTRNKLKLGSYFINEYRRGGNKFELAPHQTDITEQLDHDIISTNLTFEHLSKNSRHKLAVYGSFQRVNRNSYYGGGGRALTENDTLTPEDVLAINAYGNSTDFSAVGGLQYNYFISPIFTLTAGSEYIYNDVQDAMPGYGRSIDQQVGTWGTFAELEMKPVKRLTLLVGGRFDQLEINGQYNLFDDRFRNQQTLPVFVPRLTAMYNIKDNLKIRGSFAQGYRGPQAYDEDLHIQTVGGAALFIRLDPDLAVERSNSFLLSLNYNKYIGSNQMNVVIEGFYTELINPFIFSDQTELPSGIAVITKRNGEGAIVSGVNLEANVAFGSNFVIQSGATIQQAVYTTDEVIWEPENPSESDPAVTTNRLLRTPNAYGYFSIIYNPIQALELSYSGVITGPMQVPHVIDPETERTVIKTTPSFFENNIKVAYTYRAKNHFKVELFGGVQNIFNSYQDDFDSGADRDAGYVYGPVRPRTYFVGLKFGLD